MTRVYRPRHDYGFIVSNVINRWDVYKTTSDGPSPKIGYIDYDYKTNMYTAYRLDGSRLDHPSGRAKHFCRMADAGKELWHEIQNGVSNVAPRDPVA